MSFRIGIVGLGRQGQRHLKAIEMVENGKLTAVCDSETNVWDQIGGSYPSTAFYSDYREMLQKEKLDFLSIATHAPLHAEIVLTAIKMGVRKILCEKPIAISLKEADAMVIECEKLGIHLAVNHCRRWWEAYGKLKSILTSGNLGKLVSMHFSCGGGRLCGNGGHLFDLMRFLSDSEALEITGMLDSNDLPDPRGVGYHDRGGVAWINFDKGIRGIVELSADLGTPPFWELLFTDGRVFIDELKGVWVLQQRDKKWLKEPSHVKYPQPFVDEVWKIPPLDIVDLTRRAICEMMNGSTPSCCGADGRKALEMSLAVHCSHRKGNVPVKLPLSRQDQDLKLNFA
jgi:predicted dehydrogenase